MFNEKELNGIPGETLGHGLPDFPSDLKTFKERQAYQRGVAHARAVDSAAILEKYLSNISKMGTLEEEKEVPTMKEDIFKKRVNEAIESLKEDQYDEDGKPLQRCTFVKSWAGRCEVQSHDVYCEMHSKRKCAACGAQATHDCASTLGPLMCGQNLCDKCECPHTKYW